MVAALDDLEEPASDAVLEAAGFVGGRFEGDVHELNAALDEVRAKGLELMSLAPDARDLEQVLTEVMGGSAS